MYMLSIISSKSQFKHVNYFLIKQSKSIKFIFYFHMILISYYIYNKTPNQTTFSSPQNYVHTTKQH